MTILSRFQSITDGAFAHRFKIGSIDSVPGSVVCIFGVEFFFGDFSVHMETPNV